MLNSHRFFRDISLAVLDELPPDEGIAITPTEGDPGLWPVIRDRNHQIIMTKGIEKQYSREIQGEGFTEILLSQVVGYLAEEGLIIRPKLPGGVQDYPHVPKKHKAFLDDAIETNADYLITESDVWLSRAGIIGRAYGLRIVTPGSFVQREGC